MIWIGFFCLMECLKHSQKVKFSCFTSYLLDFIQFFWNFLMSEILQLLQIYVLRVSNKHYKAVFKSGGCQHDWFILLLIFDEL